jgi:hypothetical protein
MVEQFGEAETLSIAGAPPGALGKVSARQAILSRLSEVQSFANQLNMGIKRSGAVEKLYNDLGTQRRLADVYGYRALMQEQKRDEKMAALLSPEAIEARAAEEAGTAPVGSIEGRLAAFDDLDETFTLMDTVIAMAHEIGPNAVNQVATMITGGHGAEQLQTPNRRAYEAQRKIAERQPFTRAAIDRSLFNRRRHDALKAKNSGVAESAQRGGMIGVVTEQVPPLMSAALYGIGNMGQRIIVGAPTLVAGQGAGEATLRGLRGFQGGIARGVAGMMPVNTSNLTPEEIQQTLNP